MADSGNSETNVPVAEWTTGTLKVYHDDKINAVEKVAAAETKRIDSDIQQLNILLDERSVNQEKGVHAALEATKEAIAKSDAATEKRFESVNEFRRTLSDQTNTFLPRAEYIASHKPLEDKIIELTNRLNIMSGQKEGSELTIGKIYAAIGVVGAILGIIILLSNGVFK